MVEGKTEGQEQHCSHFFEECRHFARSYVQRPTFYLGERAFKAFYKREFNYNDTEVDIRWKADSQNKAIKNH